MHSKHTKFIILIAALTCLTLVTLSGQAHATTNLPFDLVEVATPNMANMHYLLGCNSETPLAEMNIFNLYFRVPLTNAVYETLTLTFTDVNDNTETVTIDGASFVNFRYNCAVYARYELTGISYESNSPSEWPPNYGVSSYHALNNKMEPFPLPEFPWVGLATVTPFVAVAGFYLWKNIKSSIGPITTTNIKCPPSRETSRETSRFNVKTSRVTSCETRHI